MPVESAFTALYLRRQLLLRPRQPSLSWRFYTTPATSPPLYGSPYDILGVNRNASLKEIKSCYYELAKKYHPDRAGKGDSLARDRFDRISRAYEILSSKTSREMYLRYGFGWDVKPHHSSTGHYPPRQQYRRQPETEYAAWYSHEYDFTPGGPSTKGERFNSESRSSSSTVFTSNPIFATMVAALAVFGAFLQLARIGAEGDALRSAADRHHEQAANYLATARKEASLFGRQRAMERLYETHLKRQPKQNVQEHLSAEINADDDFEYVGDGKGNLIVLRNGRPVKNQTAKENRNKQREKK